MLNKIKGKYKIKNFSTKNREQMVSIRDTKPLFKQLVGKVYDKKNKLSLKKYEDRK